MRYATSDMVIQAVDGLPVLVGKLGTNHAIAIPPQQRLSTYCHSYFDESIWQKEKIKQDFLLWHPWTLLEFDFFSKWVMIIKVSWSTTDPRSEYSYLRPGLPNIHTNLSGCSKFLRAEPENLVNSFLIDFWRETWLLDARIHMNSAWVQHLWPLACGREVPNEYLSNIWSVSSDEFQQEHAQIVEFWETLDEHQFQEEIDKSFVMNIRTTDASFQRVDKCQQHKEFFVSYDGVS